MIIHNLNQNTPEWHDFRKDKIGASYAPTIMGDNQKKTAHTLWMELTGLKEPDAENGAMARGKLLEDEARLLFNISHGRNMIPKVTQHSEHPWMIASLDGYDTSTHEVLEIKCPGHKDHATAISGEIPRHYYAQVQHQLAVTGSPLAYYYSFDGQNGVTVEVKPDLPYIKAMIEAELDFYDCVMTLRVPGNKEINQLIDELREVRGEAAEIKQREDDLEKEILSRTNGRSYQGNGAKVTQIIRLGAIQYGKIPQIKEVNLELYRNPNTTYWRIST